MKKSIDGVKSGSSKIQQMIDEVGDFGGPAGAFVKKNYGMIIKTAVKKFGENNFTIAPMVAAAIHAFGEMNAYHDPFKTTKDTSTFFWYLNRDMDIAYRDGIQTDKRPPSFASDLSRTDDQDLMLDAASFQNHGRNNESGLLQEEEFAHGFGEDEEALAFLSTDKDKEPPHTTPDHGQEDDKIGYVPKYAVCMESFQDILETPGLAMILNALSGSHMERDRAKYRKLLATRRSTADLSERIRGNLLREVTQAGYQLYIVVCVNGARNNVLVAGRSDEEARQYASRYGSFVEVRPLPMPGELPE